MVSAPVSVGLLDDHACRLVTGNKHVHSIRCKSLMTVGFHHQYIHVALLVIWNGYSSFISYWILIKCSIWNLFGSLCRHLRQKVRLHRLLSIGGEKTL